METASYSFFANRYGHARIATPLSVAAVKKLTHKSRYVLEIGAGVGTLTYAALVGNPNLHVEAYEDNEYCVAEFKKNLEKFKGQFMLHTDLHTVPKRRAYDLVIVDGGANHGDCGYPGMTKDIFEKIEASVIYFEGVRWLQRKIVRSILRKQSTWVRIKRIPFQFCGDVFYKGATLMSCKKTSKLWSWQKYVRNELFETRALEVIFGTLEPPL